MNTEINFDELIPIIDEAQLPDDTKLTDENGEVDSVDEDTSTDDIDDDTSEDNNEPEVSQAATLFYKELAANGIGEDNKEEYSFEDVNNLINNYTTSLPEQITNNIIQSTPELGRKLIDYVFTKGDSLSKDDLTTFVTTYLEDISSTDIDINSEDKAREVLSAQYKKQGFKDNVVEVILDTLEDDGDLINEAKKFIDNKPSKSDELLNQTKEEKQAALEAQQTFINSINSEFEDLKWNKNKVAQVRTNLFNGTASKILSEASKHPKALIQLADIATYWDEKTKSFDLEKYSEKSSSKQAKSLKDKIEQDMFNSTPRTKSTKVQKDNPLEGLRLVV